MPRLASAYLEDVRVQFRKLKKLAEDARRAGQRTTSSSRLSIAESNSLAVMMKHIAGNLRSRFTDFLTTDGEKPDRNRDGEFEIDGHPGRATLMADWESGWSRLFATLDALRPDDVLRGGPGTWRSADCHGATGPADDPPRLPRRPDRLPRQALTVDGVEELEYAAKAVAALGFGLLALARSWSECSKVYLEPRA